jgi:alpha-tubulin suppressor-like RCC1 family protein
MNLHARAYAIVVASLLAGNTAVHAQGLVLDPSTRTIERGTTLQIKTPGLPAPSRTAPRPKWSSASAAIATVDTMGNVVARDRGKTQITATGAGGSGSAEIEVIILYRSLVAGDGFTCDLGSIGVATCWGHNGGQDGRLGNAPLGNEGLEDATSPVNVSTTRRFTQISSGARHSCGITTDGSAYCWGSNGSAQLGNTTHRSWAHQPVPVAGGKKFVAISAGGSHTCAIDTQKAAWCWGENGYGELGNGGTEDSYTPVAVAGKLTFSSISAGAASTTCGVATDGKGYCWGSDTYGQIGDGGAVSGQTTDVRKTPTPIAGGATFGSIAVGTQHACGILTSKSVVCWGNGNSGKLGTGNDDEASEPKPVGGSFQFESLDASYTHTCGITTTAQVVCWGSNASGESGSAIEVGQVAKAPAPAAAGEFAEVAVSHGSTSHTCVITKDRLSVRCFGRGEYGQLGDGRKTDSQTPVPTPQLVLTQQPLP